MITYNTRFQNVPESKAIEYAINSLKRDIVNTCKNTDIEGCNITFRKDNSIEKECFVVLAASSNLEIAASDELGFVYGIYHISKNFLGVNEFFFWNESFFTKKEGYEVPDGYYYRSKPFKVRFRGWFINDEVLLDDWKIDGDNDKPWEMAFETLLRCGGNMTIPGTDLNAHIYNKLASQMGLMVTHHHAEPLGAQMFARAYPDLDASYDKYPDLFEKLWEKAIEAQKDYKVIWNLGFRGQGDRPFWADDPVYDTDEKRGELISTLIRKQYDLIREVDKDAICCTNLYGEIMELYKKGFIKLPGDVIFIWADNGFGKMVSRRQGNHNPRTYALPMTIDEGRHGIYYHASFYDLQAAAQMTMLPNSSEFVVKELLGVFDHKADEFWIINCSNIKPHAFMLDLISKLWRDGPAFVNDHAEISAIAPDVIKRYTDEHTRDYCRNYYGACGERFVEQIEDLYRMWPEYCPKYGLNEDDHAGEQFAQHGARVLTSALITNFDSNDPAQTKYAPEWLWFSNKKTLLEQVNDYKKIIEPAVKGYEEYLEKCRQVAGILFKEGDKETSTILQNTLIWQVEYHYYGYLGALCICRALEKVLGTGKTTSETDGGDVFANGLGKGADSENEEVVDCISQGMNRQGEPDYLAAFIEAGNAAKAFKDGYDSMRSHERGVFEGFFYNDCEADIRQSCYVAKGLMAFLRFHGEGPHFYKWQRMFQQDAGGDRVHLILRIKRHLSDEELFGLITTK